MSVKIKRMPPTPIDSMRIGSVRTFLDALEKLKHSDQIAYFYRGHDRFIYDLIPSLYRNPGWVNHEHEMFRELILRCPNDFSSQTSTFQTLVKMQHYELPTRLLDLTSNPLIALYFACESGNGFHDSGEVIAFAIPISEVKYYDSDTVSAMANIARRPQNFKLPSITLTHDQFNEDSQIRYLLHEIKQEKPYFEPQIVRKHLESVVCVRPKMENPRVIRQDGAFLLFGVHGEKQFPANIPKNYLASSGKQRMIIIGSEKRRIRAQLEALGISKSTVYPEIDRVAEFLKTRYAI